MTLQAVLDEIQKRPGTGEVIPIIDPVTEEQITEFTDRGEETLNDGIEAYLKTKSVWAQL